MFITSPEKFTAWLNVKFPVAYRQITTQDIKDMIECGLIYRYNHFRLEKDHETVRGILQYEQLREQRKQKPPVRENERKIELSHCKMCEELLPQQTEGKKGRPREYCPSCEYFRNKERYREWWKRKRRLEDKDPSGSA